MVDIAGVVLSSDILDGFEEGVKKKKKKKSGVEEVRYINFAEVLGLG